MKVEVLTHSNGMGVTKACEISRGNPFSREMFERILKSGHLSILEHAFICFKIEGISRVCSHQFVRHRIGCSYTQESQRHRSVSGVINSSYFNDYTREELVKIARDYEIHNFKDSISKEEIRYLAPQASSTSIVASYTLRSLWHFLDLRFCTRAQHEIRDLSKLMYIRASEVFPELMKHWQPRCIKKFGRYCPEPCIKPVESAGSMYDDKTVMREFDKLREKLFVD